MDSLFDASLFDVTPAAPAPSAAVGEGQLDIFGNEVGPDGAVPGEDDAAPAVDATVEPVVDEPVVPADEIEEAELRGEVRGAVVLGDDAAEVDDPGDLLNDPAWEPPVDDSPEAAVEVAPASESREPEPPVERGPSADVVWRGVLGQPDAVAVLRASAVHPVHAYLLVGPPGSGRRAAARSFAASVLCPRGGCGDCDVCRRALDSVHPDLTWVEREGASISVDQAREIIRLAMRSPVEGDRKVLVLVDFHLVTNAAPTLLKIIEEPPASTVFVVLADQVTNELVTIASRCVEVRFAPLTRTAVIELLAADGVDPVIAERAARAAGGRLDRARLLVDDEQLGDRLAFWEQVGRRVDGTGAAATSLAAEAVARLDGAAVGPLEARHRTELAALEARLEATGGRGGAGQRKELQERQKRELKRLRDDELRFGLSVLEQHYRDRLVGGGDASPRAVLGVLEAIRELNQELIRNPSVALALTALFARLPAA